MDQWGFYPLQQELEHKRYDGVGEHSHLVKPWDRGDPPPGNLDGLWHGRPEEFAGEADYPGPVPFDSLPACVQDRLRKRRNPVGPAEIILECVNDEQMPDVGHTSEIILESIWDSATTEPTGCDLLLWEPDGFIEYDDGSFVEIECVDSPSLLLHDDGDFVEHDDGEFILTE